MFKEGKLYKSKHSDHIVWIAERKNRKLFNVVMINPEGTVEKLVFEAEWFKQFDRIKYLPTEAVLAAMRVGCVIKRRGYLYCIVDDMIMSGRKADRLGIGSLPGIDFCTIEMGPNDGTEK